MTEQDEGMLLTPEEIAQCHRDCGDEPCPGIVDIIDETVARAQLSKALPLIQEEERKAIGEWLEYLARKHKQNWATFGLDVIHGAVYDLKPGQRPSRE